MDSDRVNRWLTLGANVGVLIGIVLLAIELRQNNQLMEGEARRARASSVQETWTVMAENGELASLIAKDLNGEPLDQVDSLRLMALWLRTLTDLQLAYQELPEDELAPVAARYRSNFQQFPSLVTTWETNKKWFRQDFVTWMDDNTD